MSVISPVPFTVMIGSEYTLPGFVIVPVDCVIVTGSGLASYQNGLQRKFTEKERGRLPRRMISNRI